MNRNQTENVLFIVLCTVNCCPILAFKFFPTLDGAAHLYNANLLHELLFNKSEFLSQYFSFNNEPVPNWTGHLIILFLHFFIPAWLAEKILLLIIVCGLAITFRWFIKALGCRNLVLSYLIFPFTFTYPVYLGFYNFSLALVFLFATMAFYCSRQNRFDATTFVSMLLLITLTYFSHIFVFAFLLMLLLLYLAFTHLIKGEAGSEPETPENEKPFLRKIIFILGAALPALILFAIYFFSRPADQQPVHISKHILVKWLGNIRPLISFSEPEAIPFTKKICYALMLFVGIAFFNRFYSFFYKGKMKGIKPLPWMFLRKNDFLLVAAAVTLILYFMLPDETKGGGYVLIRLCLFFFMVMVAWISVQQYHRWIIYTGIAVILLLTIRLYKSNFYFTKSLSVWVTDCYNAAGFMDQDSRVLPLKFSDNWFVGHFSNYSGIEKPLVIYDNYEAGNSYFPLKWKIAPADFSLIYSPLADQVCHTLCARIKDHNNNFDYLLIIGNLPAAESECAKEVLEAISNNYTRAYKTDHCEVWKKSPNL